MRMNIAALAALLALLVLPGLSGCSRRDAGDGADLPAQSESEPMPETQTAPAPDSATPDGAVAALFEGAKAWDLEAVGAFLPEGVDVNTALPAELQGSLRALLDRMEYTVGPMAVDGDRAVVNVSVTAADAESAVNDAAAAAAAQVIKSRLTGREMTYADVARTAVEAIDIAALPDKTTTVDAYLVREGGEWRLDSANPANLPLLNAVSGGAVELYGQFRELAEELGLAPQG